MAVLVRTNARTSEFEEAFHDAGIPFQGASLLARDAAPPAAEGAAWPARGLLPRSWATLAVRPGLLAEVPEKLGEREQTRQADLARLVRLAEEHATARSTASSTCSTNASERAPAGASTC